MKDKEILNYTLEHFKNGIMPSRLEPHDEPRQDNGLEMGIIITQKEFDKIRARQIEIMDSVTAYFLNRLKVEFDERLQSTKVKKELIGEEKNRVKKFLTDKDHKFAFKFPIENGVFYLGYFKHVQNENPFPELYKKYIVYNYSIEGLIRERDLKFDSITYPIAVKVIFEYLEYIDKSWENSTNKNEDFELINIQKGEKVKGKRVETQNKKTLDQCFKQGKEGLKKILDAAVEVDLIKVNTDFQNGYEWVYDGKDKDDKKRTRGHGIRAFWQCAKDNKLIKEKLKRNDKSTKAIQDFFEFETLGKNTLDEVNIYNVEFIRLKNELDKALKTNTLE